MHRRRFLSTIKAATALSILPVSRKIFQQVQPRDHDDLAESVRNDFLIDADWNYFNTGGLGPTVGVAVEETVRIMRSLQGKVVHGHDSIEPCRTILANFIGCHTDEIAFMRNATEGNSTVAFGMKLSPGDEIILDSHAHQGGSVCWMTRQKFDEVKVRAFEPSIVSAQENLDRIEALITNRTRVISLSHVTAPTGIRLPVEEIARLAAKRNIWFHIDGAQSLGMFDVNVAQIGCDSFAASGHKWMCGPFGTAILYVKQNRLDEIMPTDVGAYADEQWTVPDSLAFVPSARRFECGTRDVATIGGLAAAAEYLDTIGMQRIAEHGTALADHVRHSLNGMPDVTVISPADPALVSSMVAFEVAGKTCDEVFGLLSRQGFRCRPVREQGINANRISTHLFNSQTQCDQLLGAIREIVS